jgi:hypothetical protein
MGDIRYGTYYDVGGDGKKHYHWNVIVPIAAASVALTGFLATYLPAGIGLLLETRCGQKVSEDFWRSNNRPARLLTYKEFATEHHARAQTMPELPATYRGPGETVNRGVALKISECAVWKDVLAQQEKSLASSRETHTYYDWEEATRVLVRTISSPENINVFVEKYHPELKQSWQECKKRNGLK